MLFLEGTAGNIRFRDVTDDGEITNEDKAVVGNYCPDFEMGWNASVNYQGFDFSMNWIGSFGATVYNGYRSIVDRLDDKESISATKTDASYTWLTLKLD